MEKGKLYTVLGIEALHLSPAKGLQIDYSGAKDIDFRKVDTEIFDEIASHAAAYIADGRDILVEVSQDNNKLVIGEVMEYADTDKFENFTFAPMSGSTSKVDSKATTPATPTKTAKTNKK